LSVIFNFASKVLTALDLLAFIIDCKDTATDLS
jgi:hypothetical protein